MIKLSLTISFLLVAVYCQGQTDQRLAKDTSYYKNAPLYILQFPLSDPIKATGIWVRPIDIDSLNVFKDDVSIKEYGSEGRNGVIFIKTNKRLNMLTIKQLLPLFHIEDTNLQIFIDSNIVYKPNGCFFDRSMVKSVTIATEEETGMKYINIFTLYTIHRLKSDETYIK